MNDKTKFVLRLVFFIITSVGIPFAYMIYRFDLFQTTTKTNIGIAELLCIILLISLFVLLLKYYIDGMQTRYSYLKQIITGFIKVVVPLVISFLVVLWLEDNVAILEEFLLVTIPCEFVAIFLNPLPKWAFDNNVDGLGEIANKIFNRNKGGDK